MDIVSKLPFELKLIQTFPSSKIQNAVQFSAKEQEIWEKDFVTFSVEEHDEIAMYFHSADPNARLYLDALDIMPSDTAEVKEDEYGRVYHTVSDSEFFLYKSNGEYDALRVDSFRLAVYCFEQWYYGVFQVLPKPISVSEWHMMKDDLEKEIKGLAQDIVKANLGIGNCESEKIPLEVVYDFLIIEKYAKKVMMALEDIAKAPRSRIVTTYEQMPYEQSRQCACDAETMKQYAVTAGAKRSFRMPVKSIDYNIYDNKMLKMIVQNYEQKIKQFMNICHDMEMDENVWNFGTSGQYKVSWRKQMSVFWETAVKLRAVTQMLKEKEWYAQVDMVLEQQIPRAFIPDHRYHVLYQMYLELKKRKQTVVLSQQFSYTWKRSSYLYEMWCYLKICSMLMPHYPLITTDWKVRLAEHALVPFLKEGTTLVFERENTRIEVIYDECLPTSEEQTSQRQPLFIAKHYGSSRTHNRPDIVVHIYEKEKQIYLGSIIIECKYRKLSSFWWENKRSSREQLEVYYNNARSSILLGGKGEEAQVRPVTKVIVLTPDDLGDGKEQKDFHIVVKSLKASETGQREAALQEELLCEIFRLEKRGKWVL